MIIDEGKIGIILDAGQPLQQCLGLGIVSFRAFKQGQRQAIPRRRGILVAGKLGQELTKAGRGGGKIFLVEQLAGTVESHLRRLIGGNLGRGLLRQGDTRREYGQSEEPEPMGSEAAMHGGYPQIGQGEDEFSKRANAVQREWRENCPRVFELLWQGEWMASTRFSEPSPERRLRFSAKPQASLFSFLREIAGIHLVRRGLAIIAQLVARRTRMMPMLLMGMLSSVLISS